MSIAGIFALGGGDHHHEGHDKDHYSYGGYYGGKFEYYNGYQGYKSERYYRSYYCNNGGLLGILGGSRV
jgi:hypothetical protein